MVIQGDLYLIIKRKKFHEEGEREPTYIDLTCTKYYFTCCLREENVSNMSPKMYLYADNNLMRMLLFKVICSLKIKPSKNDKYRNRCDNSCPVTETFVRPGETVRNTQEKNNNFSHSTSDRPSAGLRESKQKIWAVPSKTIHACVGPNAMISDW